MSEKLVGDGWLGPARKHGLNGHLPGRVGQSTAAQAASTAVPKNDLANGGSDASKRASGDSTGASARNGSGAEADLQNFFRDR
jgi:hypothetical protein